MASILLIYKEFPMDLWPPAIDPLEILLKYKRMLAILPILPLAILPILLLFFLGTQHTGMGILLG